MYAPVDDIPDSHYPTHPNRSEIRWLIEAPINTVEVLEAILKPPLPYKIYKERPIRRYRRGPVTRKIQEWQDNEGRLFQDRKLPFVIISVEDWLRLTRWFSKRSFNDPAFPHFSIHRLICVASVFALCTSLCFLRLP